MSDTAYLASPVTVPASEHLDALEQAWGIIANANEGRWDDTAPEWREAAERWRDEVWHPALKKYLA